MAEGIGRIFVLAGLEPARYLARQPLRDSVVTLGVVWGQTGRRDDNLGAQGPQQVLLLLARLLWHHADTVIEPLTAAASARPAPVFPLVGSTTVPPGSRRPSSSATSSIFMAGRSFTDPPGFEVLELHQDAGPDALSPLDAPEPDQRRVPHNLHHALEVVHLRRLPFTVPRDAPGRILLSYGEEHLGRR
jgi:hypothetical protein